MVLGHMKSHLAAKTWGKGLPWVLIDNTGIGALMVADDIFIRKQPERK